MSDIRTIQLSGRVGSDPEFRKVGDTDLAIISLAVDQYRGANKEPLTAWHRLQLWGNRARVAEYIHTGMRLFVSGDLFVDTWVDDDDNKRTSFVVDVRELILPDRNDDIGGGKSKGGGRSSSGSRTRSRSGRSPQKDDELPF